MKILFNKQFKNKCKNKTNMNVQLKNIRTLLMVYFTPLPYRIYQLGNNTSNFALNGVGLGLIKCQQVFWFSLIIMSILFYFKNYVSNDIFFIILIGLLYIFFITISNTIELLKYLNIKE
jgi:hypothetical protein